MRTRVLASLIMAAVGASAVYAESPTAFPDFSAKRVSVPKPGERRSIVQIDPEEQARLLASLPNPTAPGRAPLPREEVFPEDGVADDLQIGDFSWFWTQISPALASSGPGRLAPAIEAVVTQGEVPEPRLQDLQEIARANGVDILRSTVGTRVSPALVLAVISVESAGDPRAVSSAGAQGLMQLMPATADRFGVDDALEPEDNIEGGVAYLDWLMEQFAADPIMVLAGYNAGEGSIQKYDGVPPFAETRNYVPKVLAAFQVARGLCLTPPELVSDGCVFVGLN